MLTSWWACSSFLLLVSLLTRPAVADHTIRVQACQNSNMPAPTCNNSCQTSHINSWTCFQDPMGLGSWVFGCQPYPGQCYRYSQRLFSCNGPPLAESVGMCNVCTSGTMVYCNKTAIRRDVCTDLGCRSGCSTLYTVPFGKCVQYTTPNNEVTYLNADASPDSCFGLRVGYFNDSFCSSEVGERVENSGECFATGLNPLDEFLISCESGPHGPSASIETVKRVASALLEKRHMP